MDEDEIRKSARLEQRHWWYAGRRALVRKLVRGVPVGRALDVGCGSAGNTAVLRDAGWQVTGLEYSPAAAALARSRNLPIVRGDARRLPFPDATFDLVMSTDMWEHIEEDDQVASEAARVLRPVAKLRRSRQNESASEMEEVHPLVNAGLRAAVALESVLPVKQRQGISLVLRARKPPSPRG